MKFLFAALFAFLSAPAFASSAAPVQQFEFNQVLSHVRINDQIQPGYFANVTVESQQKEIVVKLFKDICSQFATPAPGEPPCMAASVLINTFRAPLTMVADECGSKIYSGEEDNTRFDGYRIDIKVADHSSRLCMDVVLGAAFVDANVFNPWTGLTTKYQFVK